MDLPLSGYRILDLGIITAGAGAAAILADLGAEVIKIESPSYRDPFRLWPGGGALGQPDGLSPFFRATNRNKRSLSLDLKRPEGRDAFRRLVAEADVVIENFRRGVLDRLGLSYAVLKAANPAIVLASISSQGETGPDAGYVSFGSTLEAMGGLAWLTGYEGGPPVITGRELNYPDQVVTLFAAAMVLTALRGRRKTGEGAHLDLSQRDLTAFLCGEYFASGSAVPRQGNGEPLYLLQDCFEAADGRWVAVSVRDSDRPALDRLAGENIVDLRPALATLVAGETADSAVRILLGVGIAAAPVLDGRDLLDPARQIWDGALTRAADGELLKGHPFQIAETPLKVASDAPDLGADTCDVLTTIAGYTASEVDEMIARGVAERAAARGQTRRG